VPARNTGAGRGFFYEQRALSLRFAVVGSGRDCLYVKASAIAACRSRCVAYAAARLARCKYGHRCVT
jgi:hypothetical protein